MQILPEKTQILYQKGLTALQSQNWGYAVELFSAVLDVVPDHPDARTNLRVAEFQKYEACRFKLWRKISSRLFNLVPYIKAKIFRHKKNWIKAMQELEKPLRIYPKNLATLRKLAKASEEAGLLEVACGIYGTMYIVNPLDLDVIKKLGRHYHELKQMDKARAYYEKVLAISPVDYEARKGLQDIAAIGTIEKGWEEKGTYRAKIRDEKQAEILEKGAKLMLSAEEKQLLINDIEKQIIEQPDSIPLIKKLAELYISIEHYDKALELYSLIKIPDPDIRKEIFEIKMAKIKNKPELIKQLILEETRARIKEFPSHLPLRYEMGTVYMDNGMLDEAIGEFQLSVKDPKYRILSINNLGLCFYKKAIYDLAINQFQKANNELHEWDDLKKEVIYNLGLVYETIGNKGKASAEYKKIYEQDIHFRDISRKIS